MEKNQLEEQHIRNIMEYFRDKKYEEKDKEYVRQAIQSVFKLEMEKMEIFYETNASDEKNEFLLKFSEDEEKAKMAYALYSSGSKKTKPKLTIYEKSLYEILKDEDSEKRVKEGCLYLFKSIFHELQHHRQISMIKLNISNKNSLMYAKEYYLMRILEDAFYSIDAEKGNVPYLAIENNANMVAFKQFKEIINDRNFALDYKIALCENLFYNGKYVVNVDTRDRKKHFEHYEKVERAVATNEILDQTIADNIKIFDEFPILLKEYNLDGTRKNAIELIENLKNEVNQINSMSQLDEKDKQILIKDAKEMYYEIIDLALKKECKNNEEATMEQIRQTFEKNEINELFDEMTVYFEREQKKRIEKLYNYYKYRIEMSGGNSGLLRFQARIEAKKIDSYYGSKKRFLSYFKEIMSKIPLESVTGSTVEAKVGKSEVEKEKIFLDEKQAKVALNLKQDFDEFEI